MKEVWKPIIEFEGIYEVSNLGRVRSLSRVAMRGNGYPQPIEGRIRSTPLVRGYPALQLKCNGTMVNFYVHHLVADAFIGPRPSGQEVAHNDGDPKNVALSNLRYATPKENDADKIAHGTRPIGTKNGHAIFTDDQIREIRQRVADGELQKHLAGEFAIGTGHMCHIIHRKIWRHI